MEQLSLFDDMPAVRRPDRPAALRDVVFFGIRLTELGPHAADTLRALRRSHKLSATPYQASRLHVSLLHVGHRDSLRHEDIEVLRQIAPTIPVAPFPIAFETVLSFDAHARQNERSAIILPVADGAAEIISLARDIEAALHRRIRVAGQAPFTPHMTLLRDRVRVPPTALDPPFGARVTGFELIWSHRREGRYETLWP